MDKVVVIVAICAVIWFLVIGSAFTGMVVSSISCCAEGCPEGSHCNSNPSILGTVNTVITLVMLFSALGYFHFRLKK